jgi:hypothetical protein
MRYAFVVHPPSLLVTIRPVCYTKYAAWRTRLANPPGETWRLVSHYRTGFARLRMMNRCPLRRGWAFMAAPRNYLLTSEAR